MKQCLDLLGPERFRKQVSTDKFALWRIVFLIVLQFSAVARFDCVSRLKVSDFTFYRTHVVVFIGKSKKDQQRNGSEVVIAVNPVIAYCPVRFFRIYFQKLALFGQFNPFVLPKLGRGSGHFVTGHWPYDSARSSFKNILYRLGLKTEDYGLHLLRSGASSDLADAGVNMECLAVAGRWACLASVRGYVDWSITSRRRVSSNLYY